MSAGGGEAVAVEFEQVAKKAGDYRVVISHGGKYTTVPAGQEWASVKGTPVRIIPAGSFAGGLGGTVRVWLEKETSPGGVYMGRPDLLASAKVEAKRD